MLNEMLDDVKARPFGVGRPDEEAEAEILVAERAPGEAPARWVSGRDDDEYLLWVATEGLVLLLEQDFRRRTVSQLRYANLHEVHCTSESSGAKVRLYAAGQKYVLEGADVDQAEGFVQWVQERLPSRVARAAPPVETLVPRPGDSAAEGSLGDLVRLRARGLLTEQEFTAFKHRLLDR